MHWFKLFFSSLGLFSLIGCASHSVNHAPDLGYDLRAQQEQLESKGVYLMARPIHQEADLKSYFDDDLVKLGILPVQINISNKEGDRTYRFQPESIALYDFSGKRRANLNVDQVMDRAKKSYWRSAGWGVALGVIGAAVSAGNVAHVNKKMRTTYSDRMIQGGYINQGNIVEGFVFFDVPKDLNSLDGWSMDLLLPDASKGEYLSLQYPLSGTVLVRKQNETNNQSEEN